MEIHFLMIANSKTTFWARNNSTNTNFEMSGSMRPNKSLTAVVVFLFFIPVECWHLKNVGYLVCFRIELNFPVPTKKGKSPKKFDKIVILTLNYSKELRLVSSSYLQLFLRFLYAIVFNEN